MYCVSYYLISYWYPFLLRWDCPINWHKPCFNCVKCLVFIYLSSYLRPVLYLLSYPVSPVLHLLSCISCPVSPVLCVMFCLSCPLFPVQCGLFCMSCTLCIMWHILCELSGMPRPMCCILSVLCCVLSLYVLSCVFCPVFPVLCVLSCISCPVFPILSVLSCISCPVFPILCFLSCISCPVFSILVLLYYVFCFYSLSGMFCSVRCIKSSVFYNLFCPVQRTVLSCTVLRV